MKERVLIQGVVSEVQFPNKGKLIPADEQPSITEVAAPAGILYVEPTKTYGPLSIKNALPGQKWLVNTHKNGRRSHEAYPLRLLERAPYEVDAPCPHAAYCGGCSYQTVPYEIQAEWKEKQVKELLSPVIGMEEAKWLPLQHSPLELSYRNKMEFSFGDAEKDGPLTLGLHKRGAAHDIISVPECQLVHPDIRLILATTENFFRESGLPYYKNRTHEGILRHLVVRRSFATGDVLVNLVTTSALKPAANGSNQPVLNEYTDMLCKLPLQGRIGGVLHTLNDTLGDVVQKDELYVLYGEPSLMERLLDLEFKIFPFSFFQTNTLGAEKLYSIVRDFAGDVSGKTVFDLYCGTGTIAQVMAAAGAKEVTGIEIVAEAIDAAKDNAALNGLDNCHFMAGDVLALVDTLESKPDLIVLDPPRDGINPKALPKILAYEPEQFIYVSCKPTSLVRDLPAFVEAGYHIRQVRCCDMFPMTVHVETVVLLSK